MKGAEGKPLTLPLFSDVESLSRVITLSDESKKEIESVSRIYPFRVSRFYASLMKPEDPLCPIRLQAIPSKDELAGRGVTDPLGEKRIEATPAFFQRYRDRGVFIVAAKCATYCRFCNRRRLVGRGFDPETYRERTIEYLERHRELREVIISGGDPLILSPPELDYIIGRLTKMDHIRVLRVSSRMPVMDPERVRLHQKALKKQRCLWFVVHVNHPKEVTPEFLDAIRIIRETGAQVISQTVLLRRVNDCRHILAHLFERLIEAGVKPYYLFQLDDVVGSTHFKVRLDKGVEIMKALRGSASGLCMPQYAVDITGGLGKVPLENGYVKKRKGERVYFENLYGEKGTYLDDGEESRCNNCGMCRS
jgi:lysine 2,3-aminomutase